jgi:hypothetical protein
MPFQAPRRSFEDLPRDADLRQALAVEVQAHGDALAMRWACMCSDMVAVAWMGRDHTQIDHENRELEEAIATRDEAVAATARDRAHYHNDLVAVAEELARNISGGRDAGCDGGGAQSPTGLRPSRVRRTLAAAQGGGCPDAL